MGGKSHPPYRAEKGAGGWYKKARGVVQGKRRGELGQLPPPPHRFLTLTLKISLKDRKMEEKREK